MWAIIKFKKNNLKSLKRDLVKKVGSESIYYFPKIEIQKYYMNKLISKKVGLLGNYIFCFNKKFNDSNFYFSLKFTRGLKEIFISKYSQKDINMFIKRCRDSENENGNISQKFYKLCENSTYLLNSGPFARNLVHVLKIQKNKIKALLGNIELTFNNNKYLFNKV